MGSLFSRFRRKQTTVELLEDIDKEIKWLERNRKVNQNRQKQFVTSLLIYSIAAYVIAAVIFFCICFPDTWQLRLLYSVPLLIFPVLAVLGLIQSCAGCPSGSNHCHGLAGQGFTALVFCPENLFQRAIEVIGTRKPLYHVKVETHQRGEVMLIVDTALEELRDRKSQILEDVMDTETYKKARDILEKFDPARLHQLEGIPETTDDSELGQAKFKATDVGTAGTMIQQRTFRTAEPFPVRTHGSSIPALQQQNGAPHLSGPLVQEHLPQAVYPAQAVGGAEFAQPPRPPMPRSLLPRERGVMDKLMDYLVGDGPENRYALICQQCCSHNGMALKEEFEYLSFRCCYCFWINPARKQRPTAPRLQFFAPPGMRAADNGDSAASGDDSDDEKEDDSVASHQNSPQSEAIECISLPESVESAVLPALEVPGSSPPAGDTEESLDPEPGDTRWTRPVPDSQAMELGDEDSRRGIEVAHTTHNVDMASPEMELIPSRMLEPQVGEGSHQSSGKRLHSLESPDITTPVDQHPGKQQPEILQTMMPLEHQVTPDSWHSSIDPQTEDVIHSHNLSGEDWKNCLEADISTTVELLTPSGVLDGALGADHSTDSGQSEGDLLTPSGVPDGALGADHSTDSGQSEGDLLSPLGVPDGALGADHSMDSGQSDGDLLTPLGVPDGALGADHSTDSGQSEGDLLTPLGVPDGALGADHSTDSGQSDGDLLTPLGVPDGALRADHSTDSGQSEGDLLTPSGVPDGALGADHSLDSSQSEGDVARDNSSTDSYEALPTPEDVQHWEESLKHLQEDE